MDQIIKLLPVGKSVTCLDDLLSLKVSELKKILFSYNEKVSDNKADLALHTYAVFSRAKNGSSAVLSRRTHSSICKYHEMYSLKLLNCKNHDKGLLLQLNSSDSGFV